MRALKKSVKKNQSMNKIALLKAKKRQELFRETARIMKTTEAIVEKDFWVVWTLEKIF